MSDISLKKIKLKNFQDMMPFSFRRIGDLYLIVNEYGNYLFLTRDEFREIMENGPPAHNRELMKNLREQNMVYTNTTRKPIREIARERYTRLTTVTNLHIIVPTLRCNLRCVYCQTSSLGEREKTVDMTVDTARKVVDTIFQAPASVLGIEFQGGEPLLNWDIVKFVVEYAKEVNEKEKRTLSFNLVSNHLLMDEEKLDFFIENQVILCMSLDGPAMVHDKNRGKNHDKVVAKFREAYKRYEDAGLPMLPSLIGTVTRHSLPYPREIVDEYLGLNSQSIFMRPSTTLGMAHDNWSRIGITAEEYLVFYEEMLDYILDLNKKGTYFREMFATYILTKVIANHEPGYVDMRSPCGATTGQLAYSYNGDVYTCDEGRMLGHKGDHTFRVGTCGEDSYSDMVMHRATKACTLASLLETTPGCSMCAYKPYCGVCPVLNYHEHGELSPNVFKTSRHVIYEGMMDLLFKRLTVPENAEIFKKWVREFLKSRME